MKDELTISELEKRWDNALMASQTAVSRHPDVYRKLKLLADDIVEKPLDIREYLSTVEKLVDLLSTLDPNGQGSIFNLFKDRITPSSIWQVSLLRVECKDLLSHLNSFDIWRMKTCRLKVVK